jgi:hypothetical protein
MSNDIAHAPHFSNGELGDRFSGFIAQMRCCLADYFDTPDHGILFLLVGAEIRFRSVFDLGGNEPSRIQDITKAPQLVSLPIRTRQWPKCVRGQTGLGIVQGTSAGQNRRDDPSIPRLPQPFPKGRQSKLALTRQKTRADPHHCLAWFGLARQNRKPPVCGYGAFHRMDAIDGAARRVLGLVADSTWSYDNDSTSGLQGNTPANLEPNP